MHAVLVRQTPDGTEVIRHFDRPRTGLEPGGSGSSEFQFVDENDPEVSFSSGSIGNDSSGLFLTSEFEETDAPAAGTGNTILPSTIEIELTDILDECEEAGYPDPSVAFCVASTDLDFHEVHITSKSRSGDRKPSKRSRTKRVENGKLLQHLAASTDAKFNPDYTVFVPMTPSEDRTPRYMAICARPSEMIIPTLRRLAARKRRVSVSVIETEVSLLLGLVRRLTAGEDEGQEPPTRLAIRVGSDDTIILLTQGGNLAHVESLRSITSFDSPDTVCSRILLLQDEQGFMDPDEILVLGEENEETLVRRLTEFFEDSDVRSIRTILPQSPDDLDTDYSREATLASAVIVRHLEDLSGTTYFEPVNLLPQKLFKRSYSLANIKWQSVPMMILLFATVLFFVQRYFSQAHEAELLQLKLGEYPVELVENSKGDLQARIDSIQIATAGYIQALVVLDSILVGSDRWSRTMERTAREASSVPGIWVEKWEDDEDFLVLEGTATDRDQVVRYAARMNGIIESVSFDQIREWPVYRFKLQVPLPNELPRAAQYLRDQAGRASE
ncbi:hypothetical protein JYT20_00970 [Rhodothermus sp. AH-315-K08]|nr:hypothetical protein [Rhodothermus sp. AH-315-K08]